MVPPKRRIITRTVTVNAGATTTLNTVTIAGDPSSVAAKWRIGDWDGTPNEFINGSKLTTMHPQDVRMTAWTVPDYVIGTSTPATGFPAYQWKAVNGDIVIRFNLANCSTIPTQNATRPWNGTGWPGTRSCVR